MKLYTSIAQVLLGIIAGAALMTVIAGRELNRLSLELSTLTIQYEDLLREHHNLIGMMGKPGAQLRVQGIRVEVRAPDTFSEVHAIQSVKHRLSYLIGYPVKDLDSATLYRLLEGLSFTVDQQQYQVKVQSIVIGETLYIRAAVQEIKPE